MNFDDAVFVANGREDWSSIYLIMPYINFGGHIIKYEVILFDADETLYDFKKSEREAMVGDSLTSDIQGGINFGMDTCWYNP
ncbi:hypothetical protein FDA79_10990 [Clostridium botulinum]|nr:hypothetical protein [Clostridium botulinum]NFI77630.1 hypothetical protein [Clostridium botulinum]NFI83750.1 hypothetical protein [Clostridium botulinum]NFJ38354.1 hypothetical protein [Clostridium botulinum]